jgi:hypothetical protein
MAIYNEISDDEFIEAIFSFDVTDWQISVIEKEFSYRNKALMKRLEESVDTAF